MYDQQQQTPGDNLSVRGAFNLLYLVASGHATALTPFIHRGFGNQALGVNGLAALVVILLYASYSNSPAMVIFLYVWLFFMLVQRILTTTMLRRGCVIHSRYDGYPHLVGRFIKNEASAKTLEPLLCGLVGILLMPLDHSLGMFIAAGFLSLTIKSATERRIEEMTVQQMHDAQIEQRWLAEQNKHRR